MGTLAHRLLDTLVDGYFPVLDHFSEQTERVEGGVFSGGGEDTLLRRDLPAIGAELFPYFQDVHDHLIRVTEEIDALRDLLGAALDAGVYGMNFRWMPELEWRWGYAGALGLMLGIGAGLLLFFRRLRGL